MIKILDLNLWRYNDFDVRLKNILHVISDKQPDIIFLQEVQIDESVAPYSQVEIIQGALDKNLQYKYTLHSTIYPKEFQRGQKLDIPVQHGMAILSKYLIVNSFEYFVKKNDTEVEPRSILCVDLEINNRIYKFANIHFANKEEWAKTQFEEFNKYLTKRGEKRIMVGDFNMFDLSKYVQSLDGYSLSYDYSKYISYEKDNGTLDYVLLPSEYIFKNISCLDEYLSDHKGLFVELTDSNGN